jgi:hypothetical protein
MLDLNRLESDLNELLARAREEHSAFGEYVASFAKRWLSTGVPHSVGKDLDRLAKSLSSSARSSRPLDMMGPPLGSGKGKADAA